MVTEGATRYRQATDGVLETELRSGFYKRNFSTKVCGAIIDMWKGDVDFHDRMNVGVQYTCIIHKKFLQSKTENKGYCPSYALFLRVAISFLRAWDTGSQHSIRVSTHHK